MKLAIFDLDGTLADTLFDLGDACNEALSRNGYPIHEMERYRTLVGRGVRNLVTTSLPPEAREEGIIDRVLADFRVIYKESYLRKTVLYPGISEMLEKLTKQGVSCGVLTNKPHEYAVEILRELGATPYMAEVFGQREGFPRKPDPSVVAMMLEKCGVDAKDCAFIGDSDVDMQTAVNAGMTAVGVSWGFRSQEELWENGCDFMAHTAEELTEILLKEADLCRVRSADERSYLCQMAKEIWEEHYTPIIGADQVAYMLENFQSQQAMEKQEAEGYRYFFLKDKGEIGGYMAIQPQEDGLCFLSKLYLKKAYRGRGLARKAIESIVAMDSKWKKIRLTVNKHNDGSIATYQKLGFAVVDSVVTDIGGGYVMDDYIMEKELGR